MNVRCIIYTILLCITGYTAHTQALPWFFSVGEKKKPPQEKKAVEETYLDSLNSGKELHLTNKDFSSSVSGTASRSASGDMHPTDGSDAASERTNERESVTGQTYGIQVFASAQIAHARRKKQQIAQELDRPVYVVFKKPYYKVFVGHFSSREDAASALQQLKDMGYKDAWVTDTGQ